jgi:putative transposase
VLVHAADVGEREGARWLLEGVLAAKQAGHSCFERLKHLWLDAGYQGKEWLAWVEAALGWTVELMRKPRRWVWCPADVEPPPMPAFTVLKRRWVVERTFAWLDTYRRLSKDYEYLPESSEALDPAGHDQPHGPPPQTGMKPPLTHPLYPFSSGMSR